MLSRLAVLGALAATLSTAADFTLEQVLSAPFPSDLTAAPTGSKVAWVLDERGARNVWVAEPPDYKGRRLTNYTADDGQEISGLTWTPDARSIVCVRGGDSEHPSSEYPNPRSNPAGAEQNVWIVALDGGEPRSLGEGHSPAVQPQGGHVAFVRKNQIWWAPLDGSSKAVQLLHARGDEAGLRWSPDGAKLAFVSGRRDHSFIGVYELDSKSLRYLDASVDRDSSPVWSPDGRSIAFLRIANEHDLLLFGPKRRAAEPWSIRMAVVADGRGRQVWRAEPGRGSVFWPMAAQNQILWAGDRLVFPWERDGWLHLYSVAARGGAATLLTPGEFEVEHVALAPGGRQIVFSSNQGDLDRRHVWKVSAEEGPPSSVTRGSGIEWAPVATSDGKAIAMLHSDPRRPARAAILAGSGEPRDLAPETIPADFPSAALVEPQPVIVSAADGIQIHAQLFLPKGGSGERRPAMIFFHGGSRRQMVLGWHYRGYYHNAYGMNQYLASRGYVVLAVNYRSGIGYGMEFREALHYGARGGSEFNDVLGAGLYLRGRADVDARRIGLWGGSYGGYLTALGLARASDLFAAGVDLHGVHDWSTETRVALANDPPEVQREAARLAFESSPMASVDTWRSPVLLIHGDDDRNVQFSQTVQLVEKLRKRGVEFQQLIFPDEIHGFLTHARWLEAYHAASDFFEQHLGSRQAAKTRQGN